MRLGLLLVAAAATLTAACSSQSEPHGSPILQAVYWLSGGQKTLIWPSADATLPAVQVPAAANEVDFVFDRRLDGGRIEDTVNVNGVETTVPKTTPPIIASWPDAATVMSAPPFTAQVLYNSEPLYGASSAYVLLEPMVVGFPSADTVTFTLDPTSLTSAYGEPMTGPSQVSVATAPLSASFRFPLGADGGAAVPSNYLLPVVFSNRVAGAAALAPYIRVSAAGAALPITVTADVSDPTVLNVGPARCLGGWPAGVAIDIAVAAGAPDAFGVAMPAAADATFMANSAATPPPDGGCGPTDAATD